jgi:restriction system protein
MKSYYRIMLGAKSIYAQDGFNGSYIGAGFIRNIDLSGKLPDNWREFNKTYIPIWLNEHPNKTKVAAGLSCGALWMVCKGIQKGDTVLCPDGEGNYYVGEVLDEYSYHQDENLPHRRTVKWLPETIKRAEMSETLRNSTGSIGTVSTITKYAKEIEILIGNKKPPIIISTDETIEDSSEFALENHLEDFLVKNWRQTDLGKNYDIYEVDGELVGKQYPSDTGQIDILAISKDKKTLLVEELKKGRASDNVVGQVQRYMGFVLEELAEENQKVKGVIIAHEDDLRIKRALSVTNNIEFYRFQVSFKLIKS